jgi:hypothetical protein
MVGVEHSKKDRFKIDPKFLEASHLRPYKYFGGAFPEFEDNWSPWTSSLNEPNQNNLVCTNFEALPLTSFLGLDHRTLPQQANLKKATALILNKPMCNHILFSETEPALALMKLTDVYRCSQQKQGAWWLVRGADRFGECIVSWALLQGMGRQAVGQTQPLRTDLNKAGVCMRGRIVRDS